MLTNNVQRFLSELEILLGGSKRCVLSPFQVFTFKAIYSSEINTVNVLPWALSE